MFRYGVLYIIYGEIAVSFIALFINGFYTKKFIDYGMFEQLKDISIIIIISVMAILIGYFFISFLQNDYFKIIMGILITGGSYILLQYYLNKLLFMENVSLLKSKFIRK